MADRERGERVQMMLSAQELAAIDDFRFRHRMPSRAAALREVLRRGLTVTGRGINRWRAIWRLWGIKAAVEEIASPVMELTANCSHHRDDLFSTI